MAQEWQRQLGTVRRRMEFGSKEAYQLSAFDIETKM